MNLTNSTFENHELIPACTFQCSLCQGPLRKWMHIPSDCKKGRPNVHSEVYWCDACAYGAVLPTPSSEEVTEFYRLDQYYTQGESHFEPEGKTNLFDRLRSHIAWRMDRGNPLTAETIHQALGMRPSDIVDLGCGGGHLAAELTKLGHKVVGVEVDPNAITRQHRGVFEVFAGTAEALPEEVKARKVDCVVMSHVLEHCRDPMKALQNARSILKPGGKFICEVPNNAAAALNHLGCAWEMLDVPRHLHFFTPKSLERACEVAGLHVQSTSFCHYQRQFTNSWINTEQKLWKNLMKVSPTPFPTPSQNSKLKAWQLLAKTIMAPQERKYDCVRVMSVPG